MCCVLESVALEWVVVVAGLSGLAGLAVLAVANMTNIVRSYRVTTDEIGQGHSFFL